MKNIFVSILLILLVISCSPKQEESDVDAKSDILQTESGFEIKEPRKLKKSTKHAPRIEALFTVNPDALNLSDLNKVTAAFDNITDITFKMIEASGAKQDQLVNKANRIVQKYGYKDLRDFGKQLEVYTWAAGTLLTLQKVDESFQVDPASTKSTIMEESLKARLKKQKISNRDLDLLSANWYKITKVLDTMDKMTLAADQKDARKRS